MINVQYIPEGNSIFQCSFVVIRGQTLCKQDLVILVPDTAKNDVRIADINSQ